MWFILILLTCFSGVQVLGSIGANISYCAALDEYFETKTRSVIPLHGKLRSIFLNGEAYTVEVWGDRGAARAAAALLYVIIRYGLRYNAKLVTKEADICEITTHLWNQSAIVAPAAYWPENGCDSGNRNIDRFARLSRSAVKSDLLMYMYLAPAYRNSCQHLQNWTSFTDLNAIKKCNFATTLTIGDQSTTCDDCFAILVSKEYGVKVMKNFENLIVGLPLKMTYFKNDSELRQEMKILREKETSFLFIYDYIWSDFNGTYELSLKKRTNDYHLENMRISFLVGDGIFTYYYAPDIYNVLVNNSFTPNTTSLREILNKEDNKFSLEEAACSWANQSQDRFESFAKINYKAKMYTIVILECNKELFHNTLKIPIIKYINNFTSNINFSLGRCKSFINCNNITQLENCLDVISNRQGIPGIVLSSWTDKIIPVVDAASDKSTFLTFATPVPYNVDLKKCRGVAGNLFELAQAYHKFFAMSNWYRISVISEATESAHSFSEALKSSNKFIWKDVVTDKKKIYETLEELKNLDARIFVLNAEWSLSKEILCAAIESDMTSPQYFWITRNRDDLECNDQLGVNLKHISIGLEWRGGEMPKNYSLCSREEWKQTFYNMNNKTKTDSDDEWDDFKPPSNILNIAKAIVRLSQAFINFSNDHFDQIYNLHGTSHQANKDLASYFDDTATANGSMIFIDEWWGNRRRSIAIWQRDNKKVSDIWFPNKNIFERLHKISDGKKCLIKSGDPFAPRCHEIAVIFSIIITILIALSLILARRLRLARIGDKNSILLNAVISHRNQVASSLDGYLVERHSVKVLHEIGSGCFGRVHFAELTRPGTNAVVVAAKEPHHGIAFDEEREFLHEASILALLSHNHIIRLMGICINDGPPMVLMEHALYLDLRRYLTERRHLALKVSCSATNHKSFDDISDESLTRFVMQAAAALEYLASIRLVHRDVRAANCLIDKERSLKLADFGMARRLNGENCEYASQRRALFPVLYMAPESLNEGLFSPASDVWALGVLILEVVTLGARPFGNWSASRVVRHVSLGGHAPLPPDVSIHTRNLAMSCWKRDPEDRPSAVKIENYLIDNPQALSAALLSPNPLTEN